MKNKRKIYLKKKKKKIRKLWKNCKKFISKYMFQIFSMILFHGSYLANVFLSDPIHHLFLSPWPFSNFKLSRMLTLELNYLSVGSTLLISLWFLINSEICSIRISPQKVVQHFSDGSPCNKVLLFQKACTS